jgi:hypothetical protein
MVYNRSTHVELKNTGIKLHELLHMSIMVWLLVVDASASQRPVRKATKAA